MHCKPGKAESPESVPADMMGQQANERGERLFISSRNIYAGRIQLNPNERDGCGPSG